MLQLRPNRVPNRLKIAVTGIAAAFLVWAFTEKPPATVNAEETISCEAVRQSTADSLKVALSGLAAVVKISNNSLPWLDPSSYTDQATLMGREIISNPGDCN